MTLKIEIEKYTAIDKGALRGFFSIVIPALQISINNCKHFVQGSKEWFNFPEREVKYEDGRKTDYFPFIRFTTADRNTPLKVAILEAITKHLGGAHAQGQPQAGKKNPLPDESLFNDLPF